MGPDDVTRRIETAQREIAELQRQHLQYQREKPDILFGEDASKQIQTIVRNELALAMPALRAASAVNGTFADSLRRSLVDSQRSTLQSVLAPLAGDIAQRISNVLNGVQIDRLIQKLETVAALLNRPGVSESRLLAQKQAIARFVREWRPHATWAQVSPATMSILADAIDSRVFVE